MAPTIQEKYEQKIRGLERFAIATLLLGVVAGFVLALIVTMPPVWIGEL